MVFNNNFSSSASFNIESKTSLNISEQNFEQNDIANENAETNSLNEDFHSNPLGINAPATPDHNSEILLTAPKQKTTSTSKICTKKGF